MGEKNGGRANLIKQRRYDLVPGIQKVYKKNMYTLCTPGCTSLYPLSFNTKYVHPLYAQKGRECIVYVLIHICVVALGFCISTHSNYSQHLMCVSNFTFESIQKYIFLLSLFSLLYIFSTTKRYSSI
jgi:hypothetical protein